MPFFSKKNHPSLLESITILKSCNFINVYQSLIKEKTLDEEFVLHFEFISIYLGHWFRALCLLEAKFCTV